MNDERPEPLPRISAGPVACNARTRRTRGYCKSPGLVNPDGSRNRCRFHGGMSLRGAAQYNFVNGKTSKYQYLPPVFESRFEVLNTSALDNLEESIRMQAALETRTLDQMRSGESGVAWRLVTTYARRAYAAIGNLKTLLRNVDREAEPQMVAEYEHEILELKAAAYDEIVQVVETGASNYAVQKELRQDLQSQHESQRKLTETLSKCRREAQETYTEEEHRVFMNTILHIMRARCTRAEMQLIANDMQEHKMLQRALMTPATAVIVGGK